MNAYMTKKWNSKQATHYGSNGDILRTAECKSILIEKYPEEGLCKFILIGSVGYAVLINHCGRKRAVIIASSVKKSEENNFLYQIFDEEDNPEYIGCTDDLLNYLSETDNIKALNWRKRCRKNNRYIRAAKRLNRLPVGTKILSYWNGCEVILEKKIVGNLKRPVWFDGYYRYDPILLQEYGYKILDR